MRYFLIMLGLMIGTANAEEGDKTIYYCSDEVATGVFKRSGSWVSKPVKKERFTMAMTKDETLTTSLVIDDDYYKCSRPSAYYFQDEAIKKELEYSLVCKDDYLGNTFLFDTKNKRFVRTDISPYSYILGDDSPVLHVGTCEVF